MARISLFLVTVFVAATCAAKGDDAFLKFATRDAAALTTAGGAAAPAPWSVAGNRPPMRHAKTLFRWPGQEPNYETGGPEKMITDRPHFSEASNLVGLGRVQFENGYTYFRNDDDGELTETQTFPETLMRAGVFAEWFEFRFGYTAVNEKTRDAAGVTATHLGSDDLYIGAKLALTEQQGLLPETAIFPQARLPTGNSYFTAHEALPGFNYAYSWLLPVEWIELECNTQMNRRFDDAGIYYVEFIQTANLEYELTDKLNMFTEWFMLVPSGAVTAQTQQYFHAGFWYLFTPNFQFDIHAGVGLNRASDDIAFTGVGLSFRN